MASGSEPTYYIYNMYITIMQCKYEVGFFIVYSTDKDKEGLTDREVSIATFDELELKVKECCNVHIPVTILYISTFSVDHVRAVWPHMHIHPHPSIYCSYYTWGVSIKNGNF